MRDIRDIVKILILLVEIVRQVQRLGGVLWLESLKKAIDDLEKAETPDAIYDATANLARVLRDKKKQ